MISRHFKEFIEGINKKWELIYFELKQTIETNANYFLDILFSIHKNPYLKSSFGLDFSNIVHLQNAS